jgi:hypothetical protein
VELLVVVGIIGVLTAVLMPSLKRAREQAKGVACVANLRGIAVGGATYAAEDRSEFAAPVHGGFGSEPGALGVYEWGGKSGRGEPGAAGDDLTSKWGTLAGRGPSTRAMNLVMYKSAPTDFRLNPGAGDENLLADTRLALNHFRCPSDRGYRGHHYSAWSESGMSSYDHYGTSYAASALWVGMPLARCQLASVSTFLRPMSRTPNPGNSLLFMENVGRFAYRRNFGGDGCGLATPSPMSDDADLVNVGWHGAAWSFRAAFMDGHAGMIQMEGHDQPQPALGDYPLGPYGAVMAYDDWRCATIRGDGWQMDAFPAPPIVTEVGCGASEAPAIALP